MASDNKKQKYECKRGRTSPTREFVTATNDEFEKVVCKYCDIKESHSLLKDLPYCDCK